MNMEINLIQDNRFKFIPEELRSQLWTMYDQSQFEELLQLLDHLIPKCESDYEFFYLAGACSRKLNKYKNAMTYLQAALSLEPENYGANFEVGQLFLETDMFPLAEKTFEFCLTLRPESRDAILFRATALIKCRDYEPAKNLLLKLLKLDPKSQITREKLALCNYHLTEFKAAHKGYHRVLHKIRKDDALSRQLIHANILNTCCELNLRKELDVSVKAVESLLANNANSYSCYAQERFNLAMAYLKFGQTSKGWPHYFYRFHMKNFPSARRQFSKPRVEDLKVICGKKILIWREQGVGDEIMWYGLLDEFRRRFNVEIIVECDRRLEAAVGEAFNEVVVRPETFDPKTGLSPREDFDFHMPLADIMVHLEMNASKTDLAKSWWKVDERKVAKWDEFIPRGKLRVGFSFQSHVESARRRKQKYINFEIFEMLSKKHDVTWINLDYTVDDDHCQSMSKASGFEVFHPNIDLKNDFQEVAAVVQNCDLVLSPNIAIRTLAGAVGTQNSTFVRGAPYQFDLGASLDSDEIFSSPMVPKSRVIQLTNELDDKDVDKILFDYFSSQIVLEKSNLERV